MSFQIPNTDLALDITVLPNERLQLHEHVVGDHVDRLVDAIERDGELRDPIIVDRETGVILDGMHRFTVLERLGYEAIPVCTIPYRDELVTVESWIKVYDPPALGSIRQIANQLDIALEVAPGHVCDSPDERRPLLVTGDEQYYLDLDNGDLDAYLPVMNRFFSEILATGAEPRLVPDTEIETIDTDRSVAIVQPRVNKDIVVEAALTGTLFPPNTSRHVIPTRPVGIDVPLDTLTGSIEEADRQLSSRLSELTVRFVDRGATYNGRAYEEDLVVFD